MLASGRALVQPRAWLNSCEARSCNRICAGWGCLLDQGAQGSFLGTKRPQTLGAGVVMRRRYKRRRQR